MEPSLDQKDERYYFELYRRQESRRAKRRVALIVGIVFMLLVIIGNRVLTRAAVADFHPATCLGTWDNVANAAGTPENFNAATAGVGYSTENSAIYRIPGSQIFCGGFLAPDEETDGDVKSVALTLIWHVGAVESSTAVGVVEQPIEQSTSSTTFPPNAPEPEAPTGTSVRSDDSPFALFRLDRANAQGADAPSPDTTSASQPSPEAGPGEVPIPAPVESVSPPSASEPTPTGEPATPADSSSTPDADKPPLIVLPPLQAELGPVETVTPPASESSSTIPTSTIDALPPPPAPVPDENFLAVSYSFDGQTWIELAKVNLNNWENFTIMLPVTSWSDLKRLQIAVRGIPTALDSIPLVYLAGIFVEAHYDLPPLFGSEQEVETPDSSVFPIVPLDASRRPVPANGEDGTWSATETPEFDLDISGLGGPAPSSPATASSTPTSSDGTVVQPPAPLNPPVPVPPPVAIPPAEPASQNSSGTPADASGTSEVSTSTTATPPPATTPPSP